MTQRHLWKSDPIISSSVMAFVLAALLMACPQSGLEPPHTKACATDEDCADMGLTCWSEWRTTEECAALKATYSNCCYAHEGVGCDNQAIQEVVCDMSQSLDEEDFEGGEGRPDCCNGNWSDQCAELSRNFDKYGYYTGGSSNVCEDFDADYGVKCAAATPFCDRDNNDNGIPDLIDLGMVPSEDCKPCYLEGCNADCFSIGGLAKSSCQSPSDCLSDTCIEGKCCEPDCQNRACGDDGCGGSCGDCPEGEGCALGVCSADPCTPNP